jgi:hypothetical protein
VLRCAGAGARRARRCRSAVGRRCALTSPYPIAACTGPDGPGSDPRNDRIRRSCQYVLSDHGLASCRTGVPHFPAPSIHDGPPGPHHFRNAIEPALMNTSACNGSTPRTSQE